MNKQLLTLFLAGLCLTAPHSFAAEKPHSHWGYAGDISPEHWAELSKNYAVCAAGKNQSPINIEGALAADDLPHLAMEYHPRDARTIINNDHSVQVDYAKGSELVIAEQHFFLKQFHVHSPSENTIEGRSFPLEMHLVHSDKNNQLAVVAVMFELGDANPEIEKMIHDFPEQHQDKQELDELVNINGLLPEQDAYYRFNGSLTTPPCSEGVRWYVMKQPMTISQAQLTAISEELHQHNNRPVQPLNARIIVTNN